MSRQLSIHAAVSSLNFRVFEGDVAVDKPIHKMSEPYDHFFTASINDAGEARIEGLTFDIGHEGRRKLVKILEQYGAKLVIWRHKGNEHRVEIK